MDSDNQPTTKEWAIMVIISIIGALVAYGILDLKADECPEGTELVSGHGGWYCAEVRE